MDVDVIIIGAGPAGSTAGILLAQAGWKVAIVEKKIFPRRKVCGEFISATNLNLLVALGIAETYLTQSGPEVKRVGFYVNNTILTAKMPSYHGNWGRAFGRDHLDTILLAQAKKHGVLVFQPYAATTINKLKKGFVCVFNNNQGAMQLFAPIIIQAQGSWERIIGNHSYSEHHASDLLSFKAHFKNAQLDKDLMPLILFPGGYGGLVNSDHDRLSFSCCVRRDVLQQIRKQYAGLQAGAAVFQHILKHNLGVQNALKNATLLEDWLGAGPIQPGIRKRFDNGIFYVGNIAGEAHPIVAEGISMAMQSAWLLTQLLIANRSILLDADQLNEIGQIYSQGWSRHFAKRIKAAAFFSKAIHYPQVLTPILPVIKYFPSLLTLGAKWSGKIQQVVIS